VRKERALVLSLRLYRNIVKIPPSPFFKGGDNPSEPYFLPNVTHSIAQRTPKTFSNAAAQPAADLAPKIVHQLGAVLILPGRDIPELEPHTLEMARDLQPQIRSPNVNLLARGNLSN